MNATKIVERIQTKMAEIDAAIARVEENLRAEGLKREALMQQFNGLRDLLGPDDTSTVKPEESGTAKRVCWKCHKLPTKDNPLVKAEGHLVHSFACVSGSADPAAERTTIHIMCDNCQTMVDAKIVDGAPYCPKCEGKIRN